MFPWQTTERYLGCTQRIASAVNDRIGIEPKPEASASEEWPTIHPGLRTDNLPFQLSRWGVLKRESAGNIEPLIENKGTTVHMAIIPRAAKRGKVGYSRKFTLDGVLME
jgi:hypothetical protein